MSRFDDLKATLATKGAADPAGLAAYIGEHKYGREGFAALRAAGQARRKAIHGDEGDESRAVAAASLPPRMLEAARRVAKLPILPL